MRLPKLLPVFLNCICTVALIISGYRALAQESSSSHSTTTTSTSASSNMPADGWYMQPWAWIVGGAVFILLLVALLNKRRGSTRRDA